MAALVEERGCDDEAGVPGLVGDQADAVGHAPQALRRIFGRPDADGPFVFAGVHEVVEVRVGVPLDAEDGVRAPFGMGVEESERIVSAVVDYDVVRLQVFEVPEGGGPLVGVAVQVEVDGRLCSEAVERAEQALRVVGVLVRQPVSVLQQLPRHVDLAAVDGEEPMPLPAPVAVVFAGRVEDGAVDLPEGVLVELLPGLAGGGDGRGTVGRHGHAGVEAVAPQFGEDGGVALVAVGQDQAEHEQDDQQAVPDPAAPLPLRVEAGGDRRCRLDEVDPSAAELAVGGNGADPLLARLRPGLALAAQDGFAVGVQRQDVGVLRRPSPALGGLADELPVGGPVAAGGEATAVHEGLAQDRPDFEPVFPVVGQTGGGEAEAVRGEVPDLDPGKDEEAGVAQQHVAVAVAPPLAPADPFVAHRQIPGAVLEQQAAEAAAGVVQQEVADVAAERLAVGKIMVAVDQGVPQLPVLGAFDRLQPHLAQLQQRLVDLRLRVRRRAPDRLAGRFANHLLLDRRQRQDPLRLQRLDHGQAGLDLVVALFGAPVEMLADGAGEVVAAGMRDVLDRPLDILELPARHPASREGGGWKLCDV